LELDQSGPFQFLGFNKDQYFYLPRGQKQVIGITASSHIERRLLTIAPRAWWLQTFPKPAAQRNAEPSIDWSTACSWLYEMQHLQGVYDPRRVRGRGFWIDDARVVIHLGERVICDGVEVEVGKVKSRFIYEQGAALIGPVLDDPMPLDEAQEILRTAALCRWEHPASAAMLAGWLVLAPVCGSLRWRPHCWTVGGAGSGKSTVLSDFVKPLLGEMETSVLGASTEAGLRQHLGSDAIPVLMDEAEQAQARDEERLQAVMELARASSSETGAKTLKGTASGTGQEYLIRSMFLLSSITSSLKQGSDKSRFALLQLRNPANDTPTEQLAHSVAWEDLRKRLSNIDTKTGQRLIARTVKRLPMLLRECELFADCCSEVFGSRRAGDQFGFLMAGAFSLVSDEEATLETATAFIGQHSWDEFLEPARDAADHERCLNRILESRVRMSGNDTELPMGELLEIHLNRNLHAEITSKRAGDLLQRSGLKVVEGRLLVSANHTAIGRILEKTPWSNDWRTVLKQIPGAEVTGPTYFTGGHQSRGVSLPIGPNMRGVV
jgi:putative DNA primase/helicase